MERGQHRVGINILFSTRVTVALWIMTPKMLRVLIGTRLREERDEFLYVHCAVPSSRSQLVAVQYPHSIITDLLSVLSDGVSSVTSEDHFFRTRSAKEQGYFVLTE